MNLDLTITPYTNVNSKWIMGCNVGELRSIPGLGRYPGEGNGNPSSILAWKTPWTREPSFRPSAFKLYTLLCMKASLVAQMVNLPAMWEIQV